MCIDKTDSNKIIQPSKWTPKLKHQKLVKQKFTGNKILWKRVCEWQKIVHRDIW